MDNRKVTDHHAIIPTVEIAKTDMTKLTGEEQKILLMAANRLLCAAAPKHQYLSVKVKEIVTLFTGAKWIIEGDIKACFDSFDHHITIQGKTDCQGILRQYQ